MREGAMLAGNFYGPRDCQFLGGDPPVAFFPRVEVCTDDPKRPTKPRLTCGCWVACFRRE